MKYFVAFALIAAVASASYIRPTPVSQEQAQIQEIIAAIQSPSTHPATAAALEEMLLDLLGLHPQPVVPGPAIIDYEPIHVGPAIIDFPLPDGGAVADIVDVSPVLVPTPVEAPAAAASSPLVQIIVNVNAAAESSPVETIPALVPEPADEPIQIVDVFPVVNPSAPIDIVDVFPVVNPVSPVQVVDVAPVAPVDVIESAPVGVEPVIIGNPIIPSPAVILPDTLN